MSEPSTTITDRNVRQRGLVPPDRLAQCHALVIGVGAIGRQVALQLASIGMPRMILFDHDTVQVENLAAQGYMPADLHRPKVSATSRLCREINPLLTIESVPDRFKRSTMRELSIDGGDRIVFCCVDSIVTRRMVWGSVRSKASFFVDGRMSAEVIRIIAIGEPAVDTRYERTLFGADEAYIGACTARSTIYTASIAAGLMISQFAKWLRRAPNDFDLVLNLLAAEMSLGTQEPQNDG